MTSRRDPDAHAQARLERDPGAPAHHIKPDQQTRWLTPDTDPHSIDPVALGVMLSTLPTDDPRYIAARLAVELRESKTALRETAHAVHTGFQEHDPGFFTSRPDAAELERRRSTFHGVLDHDHLALRADPDHGRGRARRRRAA